ncbi:hypothetical protein N7448_006403 [Penicillium atrosanguineum]|uniref:Uncharacterized protein n=1 Tax=Penicillium atrosanguineum TaxID=1132637 RepID=A0A9W9PUN9_9EURO|nr:uncharacterized protein N7443_010163 [Penicillium atrosanguineum]KAJ5132245.1 hypothetical protein N7448_006403 [Penicillium atrosanguineum]KAJ5137544.1 hypothetical protein N7526_003777 [Penicillium atrosanguineum]KAJ5289910.1 hypothetical protein N7443_010163 [Penicillium atrosanguineum]KAJ5307734.1 hypothetical protein N7476_008390 [Penicillium atrosanguineum]
MDFSKIQDQVSNLSLYDLKAGVRKVQNAVMNYTEMESKVREATNNEPWGASTTLMQDIANGTHSYQLLNEIMPLIYKRFTDKAAEEWRQIYKSLQLLEFLVKNGSERVVDDARSHMSLLRMLRQFHFIDQNGKDQGINVRNRSSELVKLLGDVDQIRNERKKAKSNRNKFGGFEGGMGVGGMSSSSSGRYGGFGSDSMGYGGYSGGVYGDGGGFGGDSGGGDFQDTSTSTSRQGNRFDEYDEYDEGETSAPRRQPASSAKREPRKPEPTPAPAPVADLFDFGDDEPVTTSTAAGKQPAGSALNMLESTPAEDDDFDDFQSATPAPSAPASNQFGIAPPASHGSTTSSTQFVAPVPVSASQGNNINGIVGFTSATPTPSTSSMTSPVSQYSSMQQPMAPKPSGYQAATPNYFTSVNTNPAPVSSHAATSSISSTASPVTANKPAANTAAKKPSGDAFGSLWSTASASAGIQKSNSNANKGPNLASMAKEKASAGIWGAPASSGGASAPQSQQKQGGSAFDDLLG